jgi:hypothetical protein
MRNKKIKFIHTPSTKDYLIALVYFPNFVKLLDTGNKPYETIVDWLLEKENLLKDDDFSLPSIKQISQQLEINSAKITKYFKLIYDDIISLNIDKPELFKKEGQYSCGLSFTYIDEHFFFNLGLDVIPSVGDHFDIYFVKPMLGGTGFYVNQIYHDIDYNGHNIIIRMTSEIPNKYLDLLKEKAYLHGDISLMDFIQSDLSYTLQQELLKHHKNL